ncbi:hypothetical protein CYMTET_26525 [Cymbomonas tetramitiformis]|uniref:Uncharacterized protein n=1 Tax=Cymbomonas tetramitiformis TaxID=36881 RepID=A0AAE0FRJ4_9CHLO|nr:hypothetical protein CYMTET_26525 [Cymbomonas tetramitiformis]
MDATAAAAVAPVDAAPSMVSEVADQLYPVSALHAHEPDLTFADMISQLGGLSVTAEGRAFALNHLHVETDAEDDGGGSVDSYMTEDNGTTPGEYSCPPARGCGKPPLGLGCSAAISLLMCALLCVCATAAPVTAAAFGGVGMGTHTRLHQSMVLIRLYI